MNCRDFSQRCFGGEPSKVGVSKWKEVPSEVEKY